MNASARNNPCPSCGRNTTSHCRWNDEVILCHPGTSFSPPADIRPGDTININGAEWAFIHGNGGFSGSAAVFKPHRELSRGDRLHTPNSPQELLSRQTKRHQWSEIINQFHDAFDLAWNVPDFYTATPEQLQSAFAAITDAQHKAAALAPHLQSIWREHQDLKQLHKLRIDQAIKSIAYIAEDARQFQELDLGIPCPADVRAIAEDIQ